MKYIILVLIIASFSLGMTISEDLPAVLPGNSEMCSGPIFEGMVFIKNEAMEKAGKCYGYANCSACSDCSHCKHCNSGGSCGVCSGGSYRSNYKPSYTPKPQFTYRPKAKPIIEKKTESPSPSKIRSNSFSPISKPSNVPTKTNATENVLNKSYKVKGDVVNIRSGPSTDYKIVKISSKGRKLKILERSEYTHYIPAYGYNYWYKVDYNGGEGWIYGALIEEVSKEEDKIHLFIVKGTTVNVRESPRTTSSKVLFTLNKGSYIEYTGERKNLETIDNYGSNYWYSISCSKGQGWIYGGLISR